MTLSHILQKIHFMLKSDKINCFCLQDQALSETYYTVTPIIILLKTAHRVLNIDLKKKISQGINLG